MHRLFALALILFLAPASASAAELEIVNLYDAFGAPQEGLTQDFGFSALIRHEGRTILFDGGTNADVLKANCEALGIDLREVDVAVVSHAHFDHVNGLDYLLSVNPDVPIYFPSDMFWGKNVPFDVTGPEPEVAEQLPPEQRYFQGERTQFMFDQTGRFWGANITYVSETTEIFPGVNLVATTSPFMGYFSRYPDSDPTGAAHGHDDLKTTGLPELSLNLRTTDGDALVVGCSHSLVETIVRETKAALGRPIALVYGGFHLLPYGSKEVRRIATTLKEELGVSQVAPAHCTGHVGFKVFREVFGSNYRFAGLGTTLTR